MMQLSPQGQQFVNELAQRHGFSTDATAHMLLAVLSGNGGMAQFNHSEFGGSGQWMNGGMTMVGDMFNGQLKWRVDNLCSEIAVALANQPGLLRTGSFQSQSQSGSAHQHQRSGGGMGSSALFVPDPEENWWPEDLGSPSATGSQNNVRYAYFAGARRLAVKTSDQIWVYDTLDHNIGGFSQQQGAGGSVIFTSQHGTVNLANLPVVVQNGRAVTSASDTAEPALSFPDNAPPSGPASVPSANSGDIISAIERLGALRDKGVLSDEEFSQKKAELLSRL